MIRRPRHGRTPSDAITELNVIQKPELLRTMQQRLGVRQQHIAPTLGDTVLPVVILDDMTLQKAADVSTLFARWNISTFGVGEFPGGYILNPKGSGVLIRIRKALISWRGDGVLAPAGQAIARFVVQQSFEGSNSGYIISPTVGVSPGLSSRLQADANNTPVIAKGVVRGLAALVTYLNFAPLWYSLMLREGEPFEHDFGAEVVLVPGAALTLHTEEAVGIDEIMLTWFWTEDPV